MLLAAVQAFDEAQWAEEPFVLRDARRILAGLPGVSGIPAFDAAISNKRVQAVQGLLRTFGTATRTATRFLDRYNAAVTQLACAENTAESLVEFEEAGWCQLDANGERAVRAFWSPGLEVATFSHTWPSSLGAFHRERRHAQGF